jgi:hypothetical protein
MSHFKTVAEATAWNGSKCRQSSSPPGGLLQEARQSSDSAQPNPGRTEARAESSGARRRRATKSCVPTWSDRQTRRRSLRCHRTHRPVNETNHWPAPAGDIARATDSASQVYVDRDCRKTKSRRPVGRAAFCLEPGDRTRRLGASEGVRGLPRRGDRTGPRGRTGARRDPKDRRLGEERSAAGPAERGGLPSPLPY